MWRFFLVLFPLTIFAQWSTPIDVSTSAGEDPASDFNDSGNGVAIWWDSASGTLAATYNASTNSWSTPVVLDNVNSM